MAVRCARTGPALRSAGLLVGLSLLVQAAAVSFVKSKALVGGGHRQSLESEYLSVGEFRFCQGSGANASRGDCSRPESERTGGHKRRASIMAQMSTAVRSMQWSLGFSDDWVAACLSTTEFKEETKFLCECRPHVGPTKWRAHFKAWLYMQYHAAEGATSMYLLQEDNLRRSQTLDSILRKKVNSEHIDQVVFLGAGFDTRAYRHGSGMGGIRKIFETDLTKTLELKKVLLEKCGLEPLRGPTQVVSLYLNLWVDNSIRELWKHEEFIRNGTTLVVAEMVFPFVDIITNMKWLRELLDTAVSAGGRVTLVLMATRGPNFDNSVLPRCYNNKECLMAQMPKSVERSDTFMHGLGWVRDTAYTKLEDQYRKVVITPMDFGFAGVFNPIGQGGADPAVP